MDNIDIRTSVTVHCDIGNVTNVISNGDVGVEVDDIGSLNVQIVEDGMVTKVFHFAPGKWEHYQIIKSKR